ncbi:MAG TPA: hypothetical protein VG736_07370 [Vicinamibacterales bacterium]|jgi:hypothetical protein|nr:hypothetical protein [Vicinamibacterales bacterium]
MATIITAGLCVTPVGAGGVQQQASPPTFHAGVSVVDLGLGLRTRKSDRPGVYGWTMVLPAPSVMSASGADVSVTIASFANPTLVIAAQARSQDETSPDDACGDAGVVVAHMMISPGIYDFEATGPDESHKYAQMRVNIPAYSRAPLAVSGVLFERLGGTSDAPRTYVIPRERTGGMWEFALYGEPASRTYAAGKASIKSSPIPFVPLACTVLSKRDTLKAFWQVYQFQGEPRAVDVSWRVTDSTGQEHMAGTGAVDAAAFERSRVVNGSAEIRLDDLSAGQYVFRVDATADSRVQRSDASFTVR